MQDSTTLSQKKSLWYALKRSLDWSQNRSGRLEVQKNLFTLPGIKPRFLYFPTSKVFPISTMLYRLFVLQMNHIDVRQNPPRTLDLPSSCLQDLNRINSGLHSVKVLVPLFPSSDVVPSCHMLTRHADQDHNSCSPTVCPDGKTDRQKFILTQSKQSSMEAQLQGFQRNLIVTRSNVGQSLTSLARLDATRM